MRGALVTAIEDEGPLSETDKAALRWGQPPDVFSAFNKAAQLPGISGGAQYSDVRPHSSDGGAQKRKHNNGEGGAAQVPSEEGGKAEAPSQEGGAAGAPSEEGGAAEAPSEDGSFLDFFLDPELSFCA